MIVKAVYEQRGCDGRSNEDWYVCIYVFLVVPDGVHTKTRLLDIAMSNTAKELLVPPVDLDEALLIIGQSQPLITPGARANGVGMSTTGGCRVETDLALDITRLIELERCDVSC